MVSFATSGRPRSRASAGASVDLPLAGGPDTTTSESNAEEPAAIAAYIFVRIGSPAASLPALSGSSLRNNRA